MRTNIGFVITVFFLLSACNNSTNQPETGTQQKKAVEIFNMDNLIIAKVRDWESGKMGFIDTLGNYIIPPLFSNVGEFTNGYAPAKVNEYWGIINGKGEWIVEPQYGEIRKFENGRAVFSVAVDLGNGIFGSRYGVIDSFGSVIIKPEYVSIDGGYGSYSAKKDLGAKGSVQMQFDLNGKEIVPESNVEFSGTYNNSNYDSPPINATELKKMLQAQLPSNIKLKTIFSEGLAVFGSYSNESGRDRYGFLDEYGAIIIPAKYEQASSFKFGLAPVQLPAKIIDEVYEKTSRQLISSGVQFENTAFGFINFKDSMKIPAKFSYAEEFKCAGKCFTSNNEYKQIQNDTNNITGIKITDIQENTTPKFPGGESALNGFLSTNLHYPQMERTNDIPGGTITLALNINSDGEIVGVKLLEKIGCESAGFNREVTRVIKLMPKFIPAMKSGYTTDGEAIVTFKFPLI